MICITFEDLKCKEVINECDGSKIGFVLDIEIDTACGHIINLLVGCRCGFRFFSNNNCERIPWCAISKIGTDIIWVNRIRHFKK